MPNIKSAKKRVKVIKVKSAQNKAVKTHLKTILKKAQLSLSGSATNSVATVREAIKKIDQAASKGLIHKNNAARKKSALARKLNAIG